MEKAVIKNQDEFVQPDFDTFHPKEEKQIAS